MDYFWKENKKFLLAVGGAGALVLLFHLFVLSPLRAEGEKVARDRKTQEMDLKARMSMGVPTDETLAAARRDVKRVKDLLETLGPETTFKIPTRFKKPEGETYKTHFDNVKLDLYSELRDKAVKAKVPFAPHFGLDAVGERVSEDLARELLRRLAAVERLALLALEAEVEKIEAIDALHGVEVKEEPMTRKGAFLNTYAVFMKFTGTSEAVCKVLHGAQKKGNYLAVLDFNAVRENGTKGQLVATLVVGILAVDPKAPLDPKPEEAP